MVWLKRDAGDVIPIAFIPRAGLVGLAVALAAAVGTGEAAAALQYQGSSRQTAVATPANGSESVRSASHIGTDEAKNGMDAGRAGEDAGSNPASPGAAESHDGHAMHMVELAADTHAVLDALARLVNAVGVHIGHDLHLTVDGHVFPIDKADGGHSVHSSHKVHSPEGHAVEHCTPPEHGHSRHAHEEHMEHQGIGHGANHNRLDAIEEHTQELWHRVKAGDLKNEVDGHGAGKEQHKNPHGDMAQREHDDHKQPSHNPGQHSEPKP